MSQWDRPGQTLGRIGASACRFTAMPIDFVAMGAVVKHCPGAVTAAAKLNSTWLFATLQHKTIDNEECCHKNDIFDFHNSLPSSLGHNTPSSQVACYTGIRGYDFDYDFM